MKSETKINEPRAASAVVLLNQDGTKILWAQRNPNIKFLGGWHAFPGGKVETADAEIAVKNCEDKSLEKFVVAAVRECFEEVGVLLVRNGEKLTKGQRASLHSDLVSGVFSFAEILADWNLWIDARDFFYTGFWTTPQFSPLRFKTRFFLAVCPSKQQPFAAVTEMRNVEFIEAQGALERWKKSDVLISPPVLIALQELSAAENTEKHRENSTANEHRFTQTNLKRKNAAQKLLEKSRISSGEIDYIELNPRVICFPVKTETLPPATHTNCFIVGKKEFVVIDAAARDEFEQQRLFKLIDELIEQGGVCRAIITSHLHRDHSGGERALRNHLLKKHAMRVHLYAHILSIEKLFGIVNENIEITLSDGDLFTLADESGKNFVLKVLHTPGHARGHLAFYDEEFGFLLSSDNVVGAGSVLIAPPEGNMIDYLNSLERLKILPNLKFLCGSHGAAVFDARSKIESYIAHRRKRERKIIEAIETGAKSSGEIVEKVYTDISPDLRMLAEKSVEAHLEKLEIEKKTAVSN
ncbi:MAG TPA: MBL fold metallo-hydrolase [Pyrinomonadaceae bacterium]|nr:MBL fold metallo-hydrolase [Pyrinomonadaceae bacterium]